MSETKRKGLKGGGMTGACTYPGCDRDLDGRGRAGHCRRCSMRVLAAERRARRTCTKCGERSPRRGRAYCGTCARGSNTSVRRLRRSRKRGGLCVDCAAPAVLGGTRCNTCADAHADAQAAARAGA